MTVTYYICRIPVERHGHRMKLVYPIKIPNATPSHRSRVVIISGMIYHGKTYTRQAMGWGALTGV